MQDRVRPGEAGRRRRGPLRRDGQDTESELETGDGDHQAHEQGAQERAGLVEGLVNGEGLPAAHLCPAWESMVSLAGVRTALPNRSVMTKGRRLPQ